MNSYQLPRRNSNAQPGQLAAARSDCKNTVYWDITVDKCDGTKGGGVRIYQLVDE